MLDLKVSIIGPYPAAAIFIIVLAVVGVSGSRQLRSDAVASVVALQVQSQAAQGRDLSTLASLRALRARSSDQA
jgi:hypothetical protein